MSLSSPLFCFVLLPALLVLYWLCGKKYRPVCLAVAGCTVYFILTPGGAALLLILTVLLWGLSKPLSLPSRREDGSLCPLPLLALIAGILLNGGAFLLFGYGRMAASAANTFLGLIWGSFSDLFPEVSFLLPVGMGFWALRNIGYCVELYRGEIDPPGDFMTYFLFMTFLPSLVCGPVTTWNELTPSLKEPEFTPKNFASGLCRFVFGLSEILFIAGNLSPIADKIALLSETRLPFSLAWVGLFCRLFSVYFTLAGGFHLSAGLAKALGVTLPEGMNDPFSADSVTSFFLRYNATVSRFYHDKILALRGKTVETVTRQGEEDFLRHVGVVQNWLLYLTSLFLCAMWYGDERKFFLLAIFYGVLITVENLPAVAEFRKKKFDPTLLSETDPKKKYGFTVLYFLKMLLSRLYPIAAFAVGVTAVQAGDSFRHFRYYLAALTGRGYISTVTGTFEYFTTEAFIAYIVAFFIITPWPFRALGFLFSPLKKKTGFDPERVLFPTLRGIAAAALAILCAVAL